MKKSNYLEPAVEVLQLAPMQETLQGGSTFSIISITGTDLNSPSDLSSDSYSDYFNDL